MNVSLRLAFVSVLLLFVSRLSAQVGVILPVINESVPGASILVPVKVTNFDSVASAQFVIRWDPLILKFKNVSGLNLPSLATTDFNWANALDSGILRFAWDSENYFPGVTVPDSTPIFRIRFDVIGPLLSGTAVSVTEAFPTLFEITKINPDSSLTSYLLPQANIHQGFVAIGFTSATGTPGGDDFPVSVFPNPFSETAGVAFSLTQTDDVQMLITDISGRVVFDQTMRRLPPGRHVAEIDKFRFPQKGTYYLILRTGSQSSIRPIQLF